MIRIDHATFRYLGENGCGDGVEDIDLRIETGEFVVLIGESGCGKTTVTRMINGLAPHFYEGELSGEVRIDDLCVSTAELADTARIVGNVFQNPKSQFFNVDTTGELVFGCENQGMPPRVLRERLDTAVRDLKLEALLDRSLFELSGGEKQQIACGSAYAQDPQVFVMDEPSSNLDKKAMRRLHAILRVMKDEGRTIVLSEHRLHYLMDLADRFVYLRDGRIDCEFTASELKALTDAELSSLGLRCTDLSSIEPPASLFTTRRAEHPVIEAIDLSCSRGSTRILDIDRMALPHGSVVAFIGDNGSGKTTLAESLCGLARADGSVAYDGAFLSSKERTRASFMVMQDVNRQLFSESVLDEVMLGGAVQEARAREVLDALGLGPYAQRHPASLSGGQKQRVAVASAICAEKDVLFYDEPTSGLDRRGMERFGRLVDDTKSRVACSVVITHDPELIMQCCTHVLHVRNGRVQAFYPLDAEGVERVRGYFLSPSDKNTSKKRTSMGTVSKILDYAGKHRRTTFASIGVLLAGAAAGVMPYWFVYRLIDQVARQSTLSLGDAVPAIAAVAGFGIANAVLYTAGLALSHKAAFATVENIRIRLQERIDRQPVGNVKDAGTGALKKILTDDVESIEMLLAHLIPEGIANLSVAAAAVLALIAIDWQLALLTLAALAIGLIASAQMYSVGIDRMGGYFAAAKRLNATIVEYGRGMEVVRVFNRHEDSGRRFEDAVSSYRDYALGWYRVCWPWMSLYASAFGTAMLYSLPAGALLVAAGVLSLSRFALFICLCLGLGPVLMRCVNHIGAIPSVSAKLQALEKQVDMPQLENGGNPFSGDGFDVAFSDVRFSYGDAEALKSVSFVARQNRITALVGESGSGKSTLGRLIAHHYDVEQGSLTIGGQRIGDMSPEAHCATVSYVSQDLFLFNDTIRENIRIGRPDATDARVEETAAAARCDFVHEFDLGLDELAGSGGARLSGGQRQRIAFARAILKDAPVIVFDEATAFVDAENERAMHDAMAAMTAGKTVIVIAHRLSTIQDADAIVVMGDGRVIAQGTHDELAASCETYRALWNDGVRAQAWDIREEGEEAS